MTAQVTSRHKENRLYGHYLSNASGMASWHEEYANIENWYALALAVIAKVPTGEALYYMGLRFRTGAEDEELPPPMPRKKGRYKGVTEISYILNKFCGVGAERIADTIGSTTWAVRKAIAVATGKETK